ncbi:MAG: ribbon-helix-helix protein, CopG family [Candidatus Bathyarchaeia archaeon]|jgi:antitoxin component of RelBE/YafQ-DinJ toxin-antitoxin module
MMENIYIGTRIEPELKELVERVCKSRGEDVSDFIRRSIRKELASLSYLPAEDKKALGIKMEA